MIHSFISTGTVGTSLIPVYTGKCIPQGAAYCGGQHHELAEHVYVHLID